MLKCLILFQKEYIHQLVQSRLFGEEEPLVDMYNCLRIHINLLIKGLRKEHQHYGFE